MSVHECIEVPSANPDFRSQEGESWLAELCAWVGITTFYVIAFSLRLEFAAIECFWGECKCLTQRNCDYSIDTLRSTVLEVLVRFGTLPCAGSAAQEIRRTEHFSAPLF